MDAATSPVQPAAGQGSLATPVFFALGTFAIGTEGYMIAPLLPKMAADFGMSVPAVASLIVAFTLTLALSSPVTTVAVARFNRRDVLLAAMGLFTAANIVAALSQGFASLMVARLMMAVAAGLYTPNANALAGAIVRPELRGRALAVISGGMTVSVALGLPLGALVGHAFGWRATFVAVAVLGVVAVAGIAVGVKREAGAPLPVATIAARLAILRQGAVRRLLGVTVLWAIGAYAVYPYIAPYLIQVLGYGERGISATVTLWGVAAALGVLASGTLSDRFGPGRITRVALMFSALAFWGLAIAALRLPLVPQEPLVLVMVAVWGAAVWCFWPAQMARLIAAGTPQQAPLALSLNISTMYLGFSLGSAIGAGILGTGAVWGIGAFAGCAALAALLLEPRLSTHQKEIS